MPGQIDCRLRCLELPALVVIGQVPEPSLCPAKSQAPGRRKPDSISQSVTEKGAVDLRPPDTSKQPMSSHHGIMGSDGL